MMKKLMVLFAVAALVMLLFPAGTYAWSEDDPGIAPKLIAAKQFWVGDVLIWNDGANLYIDYHTWDSSRYCLIEAHAHVATSVALIPQKNGNPIPGQFMFKDDDLGCTSFARFVYPLPAGWTPGTELIIAAHAVVQKPSEPGWEETAWTVECGQLQDYTFGGKQWAAWVPYKLEAYPPPAVP